MEVLSDEAVAVHLALRPNGSCGCVPNSRVLPRRCPRAPCPPPTPPHSAGCCAVSAATACWGSAGLEEYGGCAAGPDEQLSFDEAYRAGVFGLDDIVNTTARP